MRQILVVKVNAADLAAIRSGEPLVIERADGGATISVEFERLGGVVSPHVEPSSDETGPTSNSVEKKTKCPYCGFLSNALKSHIYTKHPGKGLSTTGPKCRYCSKRFGTANAVMRHEVRSHPKEFVSVRTGKKGVTTRKESANA
jgi:DNA-directed RNA polymerase subunit RPC12/RpoP